MLRQTALLCTLALGLVLGIAGCKSDVGNDGALVGGSCVVSSECHADSRCLTGAAWPNGYCATACTTSEDCPGGSECVELEGGICVVSCTSAAGCRSSEDDGGYDCAAVESRGAGGTVMGCVGQ